MLTIGVWTVWAPLLASATGWLFTETARQPWIVQGLMTTKDGVSTTVSSFSVGLTLVGFTLLYGVLGVICFRLMRRYAIAGADEPPSGKGAVSDDAEASLV